MSQAAEPRGAGHATWRRLTAWGRASGLRHIFAGRPRPTREPPSPSEVLEWPYAVGGGGEGVPPPPQTKVTVGNNGVYHWENLIWSFLVHKLLGPRPPPLPPLSSHTSLPPPPPLPPSPPPPLPPSPCPKATAPEGADLT